MANDNTPKQEKHVDLGKLEGMLVVKFNDALSMLPVGDVSQSDKCMAIAALGEAIVSVAKERRIRAEIAERAQPARFPQRNG